MQQTRRTQQQRAVHRQIASQRQVYRGPGGEIRTRRPARRSLKSRAVPLVALLMVVLLASVAVYGVKALVGNREEDADTNAAYLPGGLATSGVPLVMLDAGHGGHDNGATNAAETIFEADITLDMAQRVGALLARHEGEVQVGYTRTDGDTSITPKERGEMANAAGASLLVSLHINADEYYTSTRGFQVFAQPPTHSQNAASVSLAGALTGQVSALGLPLLGNTGIYYMFYRTPSDKMGYDISWPIPDEELANDTFGVLQYAQCPAVLAEMWYISNADDMAVMYTESGRAAMAAALYTAICSQLGLTAMAV